MARVVHDVAARGQQTPERRDGGARLGAQPHARRRAAKDILEQRQLAALVPLHRRQRFQAAVGRAAPDQRLGAG